MRQFNLKSFLNYLQQIPHRFFKSAKKLSSTDSDKGSKFRYRWLVVVIATIILIALWIIASLPKPTPEVTANPSSNVTVATDTCTQNQTITFKCYKTELTNITQQNGPESAVALLKKQYPNSQYIKSQCHQLLHVVGRAALAKYGNIADTYAHGDQFCWSGYYHGALERLASQKGVNFLVKNANDICSTVPGKSTHSFYYYNCVHGLGHGYMFVQSGDLFKSLTDCDSLTDSFDRTSCYGGVFMQNIMNEQAPDVEEDASGQLQKSSLKPDQPMYPCTAVGEQYKDQCYLMQTSYALQVESYNFSKVFSLCDQVEQAYRDTCYTSLGRDASGQSISDVDKTKSTCLLGTTFEAQQFCIEGAAKDFVSYFHSDVQAKQLCASLPANLSTDCLKIVQNYYSSF